MLSNTSPFSNRVDHDFHLVVTNYSDSEDSEDSGVEWNNYNLKTKHMPNFFGHEMESDFLGADNTQNARLIAIKMDEFGLPVLNQDSEDYDHIETCWSDGYVLSLEAEPLHSTTRQLDIRLKYLPRYVPGKYTVNCKSPEEPVAIDELGTPVKICNFSQISICENTSDLEKELSLAEVDDLIWRNIHDFEIDVVSFKFRNIMKELSKAKVNEMMWKNIHELEKER
ncbi:hypothetical protein [Endozoicomonas elysicola]|uniref:Uncharacterized protein n=1 Tax=Endozoicomonas elysicola TaxID=305900 RepID=A0A081KAV7_9GAMM|nr:hypothetical protein [Endozoicomonas elysicola]KEI71283.1 hypothetical protein GV64_11510 [Endozoicomonas elysicola]